jgi:cellobiose-specific phosphotransferase system component IIA
MEELQKKLNQARAEFHQAIHAQDTVLEDAAWAKYMDLRFQMVMLKKANRGCPAA